MLSREVARKVLGRCLITGGDFAEIFEEDSLDNSIRDNCLLFISSLIVLIFSLYFKFEYSLLNSFSNSE